MDEKTIWAIILLLYIIPFWIWQSYEFQNIEILKGFYPGREDEKKREKRSYIIGGIWCVGLFALMLLWGSKADPIISIILLAGCSSIIAIFYLILRRYRIFSHGVFRYCLASSIVWVSSVISWMLIFERRGSVDDEQYVFLAVLPPVVLCIAAIAFSWAYKEQNR